jgi:hypothetical protein
MNSRAPEDAMLPHAAIVVQASDVRVISLEERPMVLLGQETLGERGGAIDRWCPVVTAGAPDY